MEKQTRKCKYCGSKISIDIGIHNWKNLFRKPNLEDYIMLFIIIMVLFSYYQYRVDIDNIIEYYEGGDYCWNQLQSHSQETNLPYVPFQINPFIDSLNESDGG